MSAVNAATGNLTSRQVLWLAVSLFVVGAAVYSICRSGEHCSRRR